MGHCALLLRDCLTDTKFPPKVQGLLLAFGEQFIAHLSGL